MAGYRSALGGLTLCVALARTVAGCGSRTGLGETPYRSPSFVCSEAAWRARPSVPLRLYAGVPTRLWGRARWRVVSGPAAATLTHAGGEDAVFTAPVEGDYLVEVAVGEADAGVGDAGAPGADAAAEVTECLLRVTVRASGPVAICPPDIVTQPLRRVALNANAQADRGVDEVRWSLLDSPSSSARPPISPSDSLRASFTPDVAGEYRVRLRVTDEAGESDQCTTVVRAVPREGLRVELSWDPPGRSCPSNDGAACDSSDVDLHLLRGGALRGWGTSEDCHWFNCNAAAGRRLLWDRSGQGGDPRLDLDDVTGHGPENINIDRPTESLYRVGVHYFDRDGAGDQAATLTIYCGQPTPAARLGPVVLRNAGRSATGDFWYAADVRVGPGGVCTVLPILRSGAPIIVPYEEADTMNPAWP
ncbi:MAG: hypothetical protein JNK72_12010 [Myxococcales bacterium]|nr:hypothetical protein [Myxococcales bacterium]